jgi:hypothetical protein
MLVSADGPGKLGSAVVRRILKGAFVKGIYEKKSIQLLQVYLYMCTVWQ